MSRRHGRFGAVPILLALLGPGIAGGCAGPGPASSVPFGQPAATDDVTERAPVAARVLARGAERASYLITVADDFVIDIWHNGEKVPDDQRRLLVEVFGATVERIDRRVHKGDWLVFHVVNNRLRWGGARYFAVAGCAAADEFGFESDPASKAWSACDDPARVARFIAEPDFGSEVRARPIERPWDQGPLHMRSNAGQSCAARPLWGALPSTWIKYVVE